MINKWNYPTTIFHGENSLSVLSEITVNNNINNVLIVTDQNLAGSGRLDDLLSLLNKNNIKYNIFSDFVSDPDRNTVYKAIDVAKTNRNNCIIAIGGGSALDLGKTVALMAKHNYDLWRFIDGAIDYLNLENDLILPTIAIPTTAGTGSEVGRVAVIIDNQETTNNIKTKKFIFHSNLIPNWVILDPALTTSMPKNLTAATGMDALTHAIEALCVNSYHPMADGIALEAIKIISDNLITAYHEPENINARANMLAAASMAATSFQKGLGVVHSLSHPIGAIYNIHHGLLNGVLLPYALELNLSATSTKLDLIANRLNIKNQYESNHSHIVINWIIELREQLNIPRQLNQINNLNIDINNNKEIDLIISEALNDPSTPTNPIALTKENLKNMLIKSI